MPIPPHVARKLKEILGSETAEDFVSWIGENESVRGDIADLRNEMRADIAELRHEMQVSLAKMEANLGAEIERSKADLMKWSFVFWVGAVTAIAVLAGVLRN